MCFISSVFLCPSLFVCVFAGQIIEYEDYDNTTDYFHVNEYEYEEEFDERPAERERAYSFNTQVPSNLSHTKSLWCYTYKESCIKSKKLPLFVLL